MTTLNSCTRPLLAALLAGLVLVTGCTVEGEDDGAAESASTDPASQTGEEQEPVRPHAPVDPCSLLTEEERTSVVGDDTGPGTHAQIDVFDSRIATCHLAKVGNLRRIMHFGYSMVPDAPKLGPYLRSRRQSVLTESEITRLPGVGDRAAFIEEDGEGEAWAVEDSYVVHAKAESGLDRERAEALLTAMLDRVSPGMHEHRVILPEACPRPTAQRVVAAAGDVVRAVGSRNDTILTCSYASRERVLELNSIHVDRRSFAEWEVDAEIGEDLVDEGRSHYRLEPGVRTTLTESDTGPWSYSYMRRPFQVINSDLGETNTLDGRVSGASYDQEAFRDLNDQWVRSRVAALRKPRAGS